jgi:hypothetical protein
MPRIAADIAEESEESEPAPEDRVTGDTVAALGPISSVLRLGEGKKPVFYSTVAAIGTVRSNQPLARFDLFYEVHSIISCIIFG